MGIAGTNRLQNARIIYHSNNFDKRDREILGLMLSGMSNREIADRLKIPMSTVQRRTRKLIEKGVIKHRASLDYKRLGFRTGLLHIYFSDGNIHSAAEQISKIKGILNVSIHIGNSDIVCFFVFKEPDQLLNILSEAKKIEGVERVVWSEEVANVPINRSKEKILSFFKVR